MSSNLPEQPAPQPTVGDDLKPALEASLGEGHMRHWLALSRPPKEALKTIKGGRLQGMTDVNPQWRYKAMTQQFGPCGIGWKYTIDKLWTEKGAGEEVMAFAQVSVYTFQDDFWSEPIVGIGGNHLVTEERNGLRGNDEAYKMAITDALSAALKMLGVAADIYAGLWDGSKYTAEPQQAKAGEQIEAQKVAAPRRLEEIPAGAVQLLTVDPQKFGAVVTFVTPAGEELRAKAKEEAVGFLLWACQEAVAVIVETTTISRGVNKGKLNLTTARAGGAETDDAPAPVMTASEIPF